MMQCLTEIVGVSKSDCACIVTGLTDAEKLAITKSNSGLFIDDLPGGIHLSALNSVNDCQKLAAIALQERDNAIRTLEDDLIIALNEKYKKGKKNFTGQIGRMSYSQTLSVNGRFQGLRIRPADYGDGVATLKKMHFVGNTTAAFPVYIFRTFTGETAKELVATFNVSAVANTWVTLEMENGGLKLPLTQDGKTFDYFLFYDRTEAGGNVPKDNVFSCSTCGSAEARVSSFLDVKGIQFADTSDLTNVLADDYAHGFVLDIGVKCDNEQLFCREYSNDDAIAVTMARAVWFKAGELLIEAVKKSPDVNRFTTMASEYLWGKRNHFRTEYQNRVAYLAESIDVSASNCYVCRSGTNQPFFAGIMS